jgi:hypothetical protein
LVDSWLSVLGVCLRGLESPVHPYKLTPFGEFGVFGGQLVVCPRGVFEGFGIPRSPL